MMVSLSQLSQLLEESFRIVWDYLERTSELGDAAVASRFVSDTIAIMIRRGQRSRLALSIRAIGAYQRHQNFGGGGFEPRYAFERLIGDGDPLREYPNEQSFCKRTGH